MIPQNRPLDSLKTHLKVPSSLLMVDDSSTMRSIVRKVLERCRFPLEISESADGEGALFDPIVIATNGGDLCEVD